ncbi:MAG: hypothetical protein RL748_2426 [Pseudomonadota bacterium]
MSYFHFSIGPVQEFVNQARRTNDFWGGSFLLSWLAGVAMLCARNQRAQPVYPLPPDDYLDWLAGIKRPQPGNLLAKVGAIPNRFCMRVDADFDPLQVEQAVHAAWVALCGHTRDQIFGSTTLSPAVQAVWQRQILDQPSRLWEINWLITESEKPQAFNPRKHWRSHGRGQEGAPFCALMAGWQALPLSEEELQAASQQGYHLTRDAELETDRAARSNNTPENLCAPALIKRHFAKSFASFNAPQLGLQGWALPPNAPSTHYLAAAPWLAAMVATVSPQQLAAHEALAARLGVAGDEAQTRLRMVQQAKQAHAHQADACSLNAPFWFDNEVSNAKLPSADATQALLTSLRALYSATGARPANHYVLLLMDGDQMGKMLKRVPEQVAGALKQFTDRVPGIVDEHSGFLVYAGGDDVLALLPAPVALACAWALRQAYLKAFADAFTTAPPNLPPASISCALLYVHSKTPLTPLLAGAHTLLDEVAKGQCGRDSVAIQVWKRSGLNLTFAQKWRHLFEPATHASLPDLLQTLAQDARQSSQPRQVSAKFFQRAQGVLQELLPLYQRATIPAAQQPLNEACQHLLREEYRHGLPKLPGEATVSREQRIASLIATLMHLAAPLPDTTLPDSPLAAPQAALLPLLQFLIDNLDGLEGNPA